MNHEKVCIGIGSNLGDRMAHCQSAIHHLRELSSTDVIKISSLFETEPIEREDQEWFINVVVEIQTHLSPEELLVSCQSIEGSLGRIRTSRFGPRTIDLDLLFYGQQVMNTLELTIPHPRLHERHFVLIPLLEIAPDWVHPLQKASVKSLLELIQGQKAVRRLPSPSGSTLQ